MADPLLADGGEGVNFGNLASILKVQNDIYFVGITSSKVLSNIWGPYGLSNSNGVNVL